MKRIIITAVVLCIVFSSVCVYGNAEEGNFSTAAPPPEHVEFIDANLRKLVGMASALGMDEKLTEVASDYSNLSWKGGYKNRYLMPEKMFAKRRDTRVTSWDEVCGDYDGVYTYIMYAGDSPVIVFNVKDNGRGGLMFGDFGLPAAGLDAALKAIEERKDTRSIAVVVDLAKAFLLAETDKGTYVTAAMPEVAGKRYSSSDLVSYLIFELDRKRQVDEENEREHPGEIYVGASYGTVEGFLAAYEPMSEAPGAAVIITAVTAAAAGGALALVGGKRIKRARRK